MIKNEPWFAGKDVAEALQYTNPLKAIRDHVDDEDKGVNESFTPGGTQETIFINESGLYSLIFSSQLAEAKKFKHWVTSEVLPSIRKTGSYTLPQIHELENKASLFDRLTGGYTNKNFRESAKALDISQSQLIGWLKDSKMIYKDNNGNTFPTKEYENTGFFKVQSYCSPRTYHEGYRTLITPTGLAAFANMLDAAELNRNNMKKYGGRKGGNPNW